MIYKLRLLFNHHGFKKYFANTFWLFAEKILKMVVGFFVGVWVARYLGPDRFGLLSYAQSFVGLFSAIATLGLDGIVVRELVKHPEKENELLGTAFILKLGGAFLVLIMLYITIHFVSNDYYTNVLIFIIAFATIFQAFNVINMYFQAKVMSKYSVFASIFSFVVSSSVKIWLILNNASLEAFAWVVFIDSFILACGYIYGYIKINKIFFLKKIKFSFMLAKSLLKDSWPLILSGIAISIYMKIDQVMIYEMLGSKEVGYYSVAVKFSEIWLFITVSITTSLFPAIISAKKTSIKKYYNRLLNLYRLLVFISIIISILIFLLAKFIVLYTYGREYSQSIVLLKLYVWSIIFVFLNNGSWQWYIAENLQNLAMIRLFIGAIMNIVLNFILIKLYGLNGAVYATLISYSIATYFGNLLFKRTRINFLLQTKAILTFYKIKGII